jgi:adenylate kinase
MNVLFFGPPGAGKGTQAELLSQRYSFKRFSTGDILREEVSINSPVGHKVENYIKSGGLVPDEIIFDLVEDFLKENKNSHILFDGFPRTMNQALNLESILARMNLSIDLALELCLPQDEIIKRLMNRRYCPGCNRIYNYETNPPQKKGFCDNCHTRLLRRDDDTEPIIKKRLKIYEAQTSPLTRYYKSLSIYKQVESRGSQPEVFKKISGIIDGYINKR